MTRAISRAFCVLVSCALAASASGCGNSPTGPEPRSLEKLKTDVGVSRSEIRVGELTDLSGPSARLGRAVTDGQEAYWKHVNEDLGGVGGRRVTLVVKDHASSSATAKQAYAELENDVLLLGQLLGTPTGLSVNDAITEDQMLVAPTSMVSGLASDPLAIMVGAPYRMSVSNAVDWVLNRQEKPQPKAKLALLFQDDEAGKDAKLGWEDAKKAYEFDAVAEATFKASDKDFAGVIKQLTQSKAEYAVLVGASDPSAGIVAAALAAKLPTKFVTLPSGYDPRLLATPSKDSLDQRLVVVSSFAVWDEDVPGMKAMLDAVEAYEPTYQAAPDPSFILGWVQAVVVHKLLAKATESGDVTREGVLKALKGLGEVSTAGMTPPLEYGSSAAKRIPTRSGRILDVVADNPDFPSGLEPATRYFESKAARDAKS